MKIKFIRFAKEVELPIRKHYSDTGADIKMYISGRIDANSIITIPLGFGIDIPNGYTARIQTRTSIAKLGIHIEQCAIDAGYKGELHMIVTNMTSKDFIYEVGDRLGYIEVYPCVYPDFVEELGNERGNNWAGSTGK